jgi:hypothetical protein
MFKKNICLISILALFVGCSQKEPSIKTYDLTTYWFNMKSLNDNKTLLNKSLIEQYDDGIKSNEYTDFTVYKKNKIDLNQIEEYTFFEDINEQNFKMIIANKNIDLKYDISKNEIKETFVPENQVSSYKRFININDKVIEEKDADESIFVCIFSNYYEKINIKDKINSFYNKKYFNDDKIYNDVMELSCKDSSVNGEYYIFMAKNIGNIFFMRKDKVEDIIEESFSVLKSQTVVN